MHSGHGFVVGLAILTLTLGACSSSNSSRYGGRDTLPSLRPAPTAPVEQSTLPPPPGAQTQPGQENPPLPGQEGQQGQQMASVTPGQAAPLPANGQPIEKTDVLGQWTIAAAATSCPAFVTLTGWNGGFRASTRNCTDPDLSKVGAWNIENNQVVLKDINGAPLAVMNRTGATRFDGQFSDGTPVSLVR
ncbi:MAG: AprI/Inh family metalloprotease inhibitor [Rhodobiaceae bacterium]|nr:AprI/Inh family metalloprotease inhibitor [Rhodobiaceae bacterium]MCC0055573.1 AprI/Inh family metalloprotease inhibitor [Rhodobiaceae bacterium]MCC0056684.1 AprI/Inh family metalloprotease inhibitor [Rhodobiaceae bacterium]